MQISFFASAIKVHLWEKVLDSLKSNTIGYEVVFSGWIDKGLIKEITEKYPNFRYINTLDIKPAQCYEIARRACKGDYIIWGSDDCEFPEKALDKIYNKIVTSKRKTILAINTIDPECMNNNLNDQRFFPRNVNTPQMAVMGCMDRNYLEELGGLDKKYVYGKWECDICMRVLADGGQILPYTDISINIEHTSKNWQYNNDWSGVNEDSESLENSWVVEGYKDFEKPLYVIGNAGLIPYFPISNREVTFKRRDKFEPYEDEGITEKSQGKNTRWL